MEEQNKIAVLNRDVIKYIAMVTMLLNHIATIFLESGALHDAFEFIGYFTAPVMCYFLVEGYHYTRSKKKYGQRLLVFACISQIPYHFAFQFGNLNMIFTLFICFLILVAQEKIANPTLCRIVKVLLMLVTIFSDWSVIAAVKNSSAVINSGNSDVAHSTMVTPTISEGSSRGCVNQSDIPVSCRIFQQVYGDRQGE